MIFFLLVLAVIVGCGCGILGAMGGAGNLIWRREFIPIILSVVYVVSLLYYQLIFFLVGPTPMAYWGAYAIGYGIPDVNGPKGSALGGFFSKLFKGNHELASIFTRGVIGILKAVIMLSVPLITGHWFLWAAFAGLIIFNQILWTSIIRSLGQYRLFGKDLLWEETFLCGIDAFLVVLLIFTSLFLMR